VREEIAVEVELRVHIGIQLPVRGETQRQLAREDHAQEADHQDDQHNDPVLPPALNWLHRSIH
jgi:hypothetical protein